MFLIYTPSIKLTASFLSPTSSIAEGRMLVVIYFASLSDTKSITLDYDASEVNECMAVYEQIIKIFKPYTRKTAPSAKKDIELTGKGIQIFPLAGAKYYMIDLNCEYNENAKRYQLNILMFENNWWK